MPVQGHQEPTMVVNDLFAALGRLTRLLNGLGLFSPVLIERECGQFERIRSIRHLDAIEIKGPVDSHWQATQTEDVIDVAAEDVGETQPVIVLSTRGPRYSAVDAVLVDYDLLPG